MVIVGLGFWVGKGEVSLGFCFACCWVAEWRGMVDHRRMGHLWGSTGKRKAGTAGAICPTAGKARFAALEENGSR